MPLAEKRKSEHLSAKEFIFNGDNQKALAILLTAMDKYGPHVGLLSDIATCYYYMGDMWSFKQTLVQLNHEFQHAQELLNRENLIRTLIFIGKGLEEQNQLAFAVTYYERALKLIKPLETDMQARCLSQLVRIKSYLQQTQKLSEHYQHLTLLKPSYEDLEIEVQHSLMVCEIILLGPETASVRFDKIFSQYTLHNFNERLVAFDYLEEILRVNTTHAQMRINRIKSIQLGPEDRFEALMLRILNKENPSIIMGFLNQLSHLISPCAHLRLLFLLIHSCDQKVIKTELKKKLLFLLDQADPDTKHLLTKKWDINLSSDWIELTLSTAQQSISFNNESKSFSKSQNSFEILLLLSKDNELDLDVIIKKIWNAEFDTSYYHRLRIQINRLNKELQLLCGIPHSSNSTKDQLKIQYSNFRKSAPFVITLPLPSMCLEGCR